MVILWFNNSHSYFQVYSVPSKILVFQDYINVNWLLLFRQSFSGRPTCFESDLHASCQLKKGLLLTANCLLIYNSTELNNDKSPFYLNWELFFKYGSLAWIHSRLPYLVFTFCKTWTGLVKARDLSPNYNYWSWMNLNELNTNCTVSLFLLHPQNYLGSKFGSCTVSFLWVQG